MAYEVNYDDERFQDVKDSEKTALKEHDDMVSGMVSQIDDKYNALVNASKDYQKEQERIQNEQTDFAIKQIEQKKAWAEKDYKKEQSGAYTDWQKQSNQYGVNAEKMAAQGLGGAGYSESSQVSMYNTYQNRVATAREAFLRTKENYDNSITQAQLQNSSVLAQIAADAQKEQLTLLLEGFQYKNTLVLEQAAQRRAIEQNYYTRYQDVLSQINLENQQKTAAEQWEKNYQLQLEQFNLQKEQIEDAKIEKERARTAKAGATKAAAAGAAIAAEAAKIENKRVEPKKENALNSRSKESIAKYAGKITTNAERATYLDQCVKAGTITQKEADEIFESKYNLKQSNWTMVDNGGVNWFGGLDGNAKYKNEVGDVYSANDLVKALKKQGMSEKLAKSYVLNLQKKYDY